MTPKPKLDITRLIEEAALFAEIESKYDEPSLYGVTEPPRQIAAWQANPAASTSSAIFRLRRKFPMRRFGFSLA